MFLRLISLRKQGQNLEMEKEYFMQPEQMKDVFFEGKFLKRDE